MKPTFCLVSCPSLSADWSRPCGAVDRRPLVAEASPIATLAPVPVGNFVAQRRRSTRSAGGRHRRAAAHRWPTAGPVRGALFQSHPNQRRRCHYSDPRRRWCCGCNTADCGPTVGCRAARRRCLCRRHQLAHSNLRRERRFGVGSTRDSVIMGKEEKERLNIWVRVNLRYTNTYI